MTDLENIRLLIGDYYRQQGFWASVIYGDQDFADNILNDCVWASARKTLDDAELKSASFEVWTNVVVTKIRELLGSL